MLLMRFFTINHVIAFIEKLVTRLETFAEDMDRTARAKRAQAMDFHIAADQHEADAEKARKLATALKVQ